MREEPNLASLLSAATDLGPEGAEGIAATVAPWTGLMFGAGRPTSAIGLGVQATNVISAVAPATRAEARIRKALGDLYLRTDRLRDAEDAYQSALPIYQQIEDRLGEANTLEGMGTLAKSRGDHARAYDLFLQSLAIRRSIESLLGEGNSYLYLARTARAANQFQKAVVLGRRAWSIYRRIESLFNQFLALEDLIDCFTALDDEETRRAALQLAWHLGQALQEPAIQRSLSVLRQRFPDFIPATEPPEGWLPETQAALESALERYEQALAVRGEDPLAPLVLP